VSSTIVKETVKVSIFHKPVTVTTTAAALISVAVNLPNGVKKGLLVKAPGPTDDAPNTASVFIGNGASVSADQTDAGGFPLAPGESVTLPLDSIDRLYAIVASGTEVLNCIII